MEIKTFRCPECGANFDSSENVTFCSHCGAKLYFDDGTRNINYNYRTENVAKLREAEINRELELDKRQYERKNQKYLFPIIILCFVLMLAIPFIVTAPAYYSSKSQEEELQNTVNEIYTDINEGSYEKALIKAKTLYYTADWSDEIKEKWDNTRESIIEIIEEKMK